MLTVPSVQELLPGLGRRLSRHLLLFQSAQVTFLAPMSDDLQQTVSPYPKKSNVFFWFPQALTHVLHTHCRHIHIYTHMCTHTHILRKKMGRGVKTQYHIKWAQLTRLTVNPVSITILLRLFRWLWWWRRLPCMPDNLSSIHEALIKTGGENFIPNNCSLICIHAL